MKTVEDDMLLERILPLLSIPLISGAGGSTYCGRETAVNEAAGDEDEDNMILEAKAAAEVDADICCMVALDNCCC